MTDREKFEAWANSRWDNTLGDKYSDGDYLFEPIQREWEAWQAALASQQPADDGWIEEAGGECPVVEGDIIHVKLRGGAQSGFSVCKPLSLQWEHEDNGWDIIAYRVVKP